MPFTVEAVCVLPDHLHTIWTLPHGDDDYPSRWKKLKGIFSREFRARGGSPGEADASRRQKGEVAVWQRRYWEHRIRDPEDLRRHVEYTHFNPVKHGHVTNLTDWPWSSFHDHVSQGWVDPEWGTIEPEDIKNLETGE
jgi:putative transposase